MKFFATLLSLATAQTTTAAATTAAASGDLDATNTPVELKIQGQSGKLTLVNPDDSAKSVTITMDALTERDADGNAVGTGGQGAHSFNTFATKEFTIADLEETTFEGVGCWKTSFSSTINGGDFKVTIYLMKEEVTVANDDEEITIGPNQVKFTVEINNWAWCLGSSVTDTSSANYCKQGQNFETGAYLDFDLAIKGPKAPQNENAGKKPADGEPATVDLGDGVSIALSTKVKVDDAWQDMPGADDATDYYPKVTTQGSSTIYTFRFPKGDKLFYDPAVDVGASATSSASVTAASVLLLGAATTL